MTTITVLLIEGNNDVCFQMKVGLEREGHMFLEYLTGTDFIQKIHREFLFHVIPPNLISPNNNRFYLTPIIKKITNALISKRE